ncbi:MAG TPA: hypothetical protein VFB62_11730 [Polyangiaceae bacterium]|nr:hypothetical protein [Polyangiaceae bacterium]
MPASRWMLLLTVASCGLDDSGLCEPGNCSCSAANCVFICEKPPCTVDCASDAQCTIDCAATAPGPDCSIDCAAGEVTQCPDMKTLACNAPCP